VSDGAAPVVDYAVQPAAHEDAKADARAAAKWLIGSFAGVGAVLVSGVGLSSIGDLGGVRLGLAIFAFVVGVAGVIVAVTAVADVLTPAPVTLKELAERQRRRNEGGGEDRLVEYLEGDPSFFQGIAHEAPAEQSLIVAADAYEAALAARFNTAEAYWRAEEDDAPESEAHKAEKAMDVANVRVETMHLTVRRLERIAAAQQTVFQLRSRRDVFVGCAAAVAASVATFAAVAGSSG
jgi:hypothetical protein